MKLQSIFSYAPVILSLCSSLAVDLFVASLTSTSVRCDYNCDTALTERKKEKRIVKKKKKKNWWLRRKRVSRRRDTEANRLGRGRWGIWPARRPRRARGKWRTEGAAALLPHLLAPLHSLSNFFRLNRRSEVHSHVPGCQLFGFSDPRARWPWGLGVFFRDSRTFFPGL